MNLKKHFVRGLERSRIQEDVPGGPRGIAPRPWLQLVLVRGCGLGGLQQHLGQGTTRALWSWKERGHGERPRWPLDTLSGVSAGPGFGERAAWPVSAGSPGGAHQPEEVVSQLRKGVGTRRRMY